MPLDTARPTTNSTAAAGPGAKCGSCSVRFRSVCGALADAELPALAGISAPVSLSAGEMLFAEGDPAGRVFIVTAGAIKTYRLMSDGRRQIVGFFFAGDVFAATNSPSYGYSAEAIAGAELCAVARNALYDLMERHPKLAHGLLSAVNHELALAQDQMLLLGRTTVSERMAWFLLTMRERTLRRTGVGDRVNLPIVRADIADYLGISTETVSRVLSRFRRAKLVSLPMANHIILHDIDKLKTMAGDIHHWPDEPTQRPAA
jgi:CRP/FNR family transcriptional regulator